MNELLDWLSKTGNFCTKSFQHIWNVVNDMNGLAWWSAFYPKSLINYLYMAIHFLPIAVTFNFNIDKNQPMYFFKTYS